MKLKNYKKYLLLIGKIHLLKNDDKINFSNNILQFQIENTYFKKIITE
jgi:hypothetical protein